MNLKCHGEPACPDYSVVELRFLSCQSILRQAANDMIYKFKYPLLSSLKIGTSVVPLTLGGQLRPLSRFKGCGRNRGLIFFVIYTLCRKKSGELSG